MRGKNLAFFLLTSTLVWSMHPSIARADAYPIIDDVIFHDFAKIPGSPDEAHQTALKAGDSISLQVNVDSIYMPEPIVTVDLSQLGFSNATTTSASNSGLPGYHWVPNNRAYYTNYVYEFGPLSIGDVPDGPKDIPIAAIDAAGNTVASTTHILIDNALPTISLSTLTFSTSTPDSSAYMYLSGSLNGTGSSIVSGRITETLLDADGNKMVGYWPWSYTVEYGALDLFAHVSENGSFTRVPFQLAEGESGEISRSDKFKLKIQVFDAAGNSATTEIVVPLHAQQPQVSQASNVLFLPGIEGSRLYEGSGCGKNSEEMLWEPYEGLVGLVRGVGDKKMGDLALTTAGTSACTDIYAKEGDIIDAVHGSAIYASLISEMDGLKTAGTINDWKPVAYDWRLSLDDLITKGTQHGNRIFYEEATSTPYIEQTLRSLASSSKTGKVTIIAHSNGGLVTKALLKRLGSEASQSLVDKIIMIGVPQSGAPLTIGSSLVGYDAGIYAKYGVKIVSNAAARSLAQNSPMAYHLLPSEDYFWSAGNDAAHPVIQFNGYGYANEALTYGSVIKNRDVLDNFLLATEGTREKPKKNDLKSLEILNPDLIRYANVAHGSLDAWVPPPGIEVSQIAGWGVDTVGGIDFYTASTTLLNFLDSRRRYRPVIIEDGDGTVPIPSALLMASSTNVRSYWLNIKNTGIRHGDIFESTDLERFLKNIITDVLAIPTNISDTPPTSSNAKKLTFLLHSLVSFEIKDAYGRTSATRSGPQSIPGLDYGEFGGVMYITVPDEGQYQVRIQGQGDGLLDLDMQERSGSTITASSTVENIPITESTLVTLTISGGLETASPITVDRNGDGQSVVTLEPIVGDTVIYPELQEHGGASDDSITPTVTGGGAGGSSEPTADVIGSVIATVVPVIELPPILATTSDVTISTSTIEVATSAPVVVVPSLIRIAVQRATRNLPMAKQRATIPDLSQTASVYGATHQPIFTKFVFALSDGVHRFWVTIRKLF